MVLIWNAYIYLVFLKLSNLLQRLPLPRLQNGPHPKQPSLLLLHVKGGRSGRFEAVGEGSAATSHCYLIFGTGSALAL